MALINTTPISRRKASGKVPVTTQLAGQVTNSDGGFVHTVDCWSRLNRFLVIGVEGGTYYVKEPDLLKSNHSAVLECVKKDGVRTVNEIVAVSESGRAQKNDPAILALALCASHGDEATKRAAYAALPKVCRIGTHLFHFAAYVDGQRGWGSGLRKAVSRWYTEREPDKLAMQLVKYQQRDGWSHRDILRKAHPKTSDKKVNAALRWAVCGSDGLGTRKVARKGCDTPKTYATTEKSLPALIAAFEEAKTADEKALVRLIVDHGLPREAIPTEKLNSLAVWEALLHRMPITAMVRNLGKMSSIGLVKPLSAAALRVINTLGDKEAIRKSRIHPMSILVALKTYASGHGLKGSLSWSAVPQVLSALDDAFYLAFPNVAPTGKNVMIGLDISGSMSGSAAGNTCLTAAEAVAALSLVFANVEKSCLVTGFADRLVVLNIRKGMTLNEAMKETSNRNFGYTQPSLLLDYAEREKMDVGGYIVMTDNEVNAGDHVSTRMAAYRKKHVKDSRLVVMATTSTEFTVNDPNDPLGLDVCGFDTGVPPLVSDFIRGDSVKEAAVEEED